MVDGGNWWSMGFMVWRQIQDEGTGRSQWSRRPCPDRIRWLGALIRCVPTSTAPPHHDEHNNLTPDGAGGEWAGGTMEEETSRRTSASGQPNHDEKRGELHPRGLTSR